MLPSDAFLSTRHIFARQLSGGCAAKVRGTPAGAQTRRRKRARLSRILNAATILFVLSFFVLILVLSA